VLQALLPAEKIIRYSYMLLYVMRIINRCMVNLFLIKYYVVLIVSLNFLCKLCFDAKKLVIYDYANCCFFSRRVDDRITYPRMSFLEELRIPSATRVL
jgi:hypothetical protein